MVRQLLTESLLLAIPAAAAAFGVAYGIIQAGYSLPTNILHAKLSETTLGPVPTPWAHFELFDAGGYAAGVLLVIAAAFAASWLPARRAVNLDPARSLRCD